MNLRHDIIENRILFSNNSLDEAERSDKIRRALKGLERYFYLVSFVAYCDGSNDNFGLSFSAWLDSREEIVSMTRKLRKGTYHVFAPADDLSGPLSLDLTFTPS